MKYLISYLIIAFLLIFSTANAQDSYEESKTKTQVGISALVKKQPYTGISTKAYPIPFIFHQEGAFYLSGLTSGYRFYRNDFMWIDLFGKFRFEGYNNSDSSDLRGMSDRKNSLDAGLKLGFDLGNQFRLTAYYIGDITGRHSGQEFKMDLAKSFTFENDSLKNLRLTPYIGAKIQSSQVLDYYYGVKQNEATPTRNAYDASSDIDLLTGLNLIYDLNGPWSIFGNLEHTRLGNQTTDSPIVNKHHTNSFILGLIYEF